MRKRSLPIGKRTVLLLAAALLVIVALSWRLGGESLPTLEEMNMAQGESAGALPVYDGEAWQPGGADAEGFVEAIDNGRFALRIDPKTTQIIVTDKKSGYVWRSNPPEPELKEETVKGLLLSNLKSPLVVEYFSTDGSDKARRELINTASKELQTSLLRYENGLQVTYTFTQKQIRLVIQYELTGTGLIVRVPDEGIAENGNYALFSLDVLPYFGAARAGEDGYIFVPDGPGGLIHFTADRSSLSQGYVSAIYGSEISNVRSDLNSSKRQTKQEAIAYPTFGLKRGEHAYLAIVQDGKEEADIKAMPPGLKSTYYNVGVSFKYREEYLRRSSRLQNPVKTVESSRMKLDRSVEYRFLNGSEANYAGMAGAYRQELQEEGRLGAKLAPVGHIPLNLSIIGGNSEEAYNKERYVTATTFAQASEMVTELNDSGVHNIRIIYFGWQSGGDFNASQRFPIESKLGGQAAAEAFVDQMHALGFQVLFEDNFVYIDSERSPVSAKSAGMRGIDGTVFFDWGEQFVLKPAVTAGYVYETVAKLKAIGVDGIHFNWLGEMTFRDYESPPVERADTERLYRSVLSYTQQELGQAGVYRGNDYTLGAVSYMTEFPLESNYNLIVDETVPFYPIALHGYVSYSGTPGNVRSDYDREFLKAVEYGAIPSFYLTYEPSRVLKNTPSDYIFSSRFEIWKERIRQEYRDFDKLAKLYDKTIVGHEKQADDRFVTIYEDGTKVTVDYAQKTFSVQDGGAR
ncbi:DUF5696 domain-containing protein [Paenibacillus sp. GCM10027626]|uniref:DUF5696 domain-containing protein n=1 Tax=Paenibacillus sp. GCM10027626 TaxID=3273411 RepID=UPI003640179D